MNGDQPAPPAPVEILQRPIPWISRRRRTWAGVLIGTILAVYALSLSDHWYIGHDSALYLCLGRNLARGEGYTLAGQPHAHVPPAFPMLLAALMRLGLGSFLAMNVVMGLLGLASAAAAHAVLRQLVHRDWAMVLTAVFALSAVMVQTSGEILSDVPFMLLVLTAFWLYLRGLRRTDPRRGGWEVAALLLVAACWFRIAGLPLVAGAVLGLLIACWRRAGSRAALSLAIVGIGILATFSIFEPAYLEAARSGGATYAGMLTHQPASFLSKWLIGPIQHLYASSGQLSRLYLSPAVRLPGPLSMLLLVLPVLAAMIRRCRRMDTLGPVAVFFYVAALSFILKEIRTRYMLPIMPLLLVYLLEGYLVVGGALLRRWRQDRLAAVPMALAVVIIACNVPLVGRLILQKSDSVNAIARKVPLVARLIEQDGDYEWAQQKGLWQDQYRAAVFLKTVADPGTVILADYPVAYLADLPCPAVSPQLLKADLTGPQVDELLARHRIAYFVFDPQDKANPPDKTNPPGKAINDHLAATTNPIFTSGRLRMYKVGPGSPRSSPFLP